MIHAAIRQSSFSRDIRCLGFVAEADLPALYRAADVFVYPSLYEGFGFPPLEAMACGCPVICSTRGALGEVIGKAAATVDPEDVAALQFQLTRLAADKSLCSYLRQAGFDRVQAFNWEHTVAQTMNVYALAIQGANERAAVGPRVRPSLSSR
jgi:glycosyltransferase involved in cell wall biosynthesis